MTFLEMMTRFRKDPTPGAAANLLADAMQASGRKEINDAELIEAVFVVRDALYRIST